MTLNLEQQYHASQDELRKAKKDADRWKREATDIAGKLANLKKQSERTEAFRRILFDNRCSGLVFHILDRDTAGSRPVPVVVPTKILAEHEPKTWAATVEASLRDAIAASRSVDFDPLDPNEREAFATSRASSQLVLDEVGAEEGSAHEAVRAWRLEREGELAHEQAEVQRLERELENMTADRDRLLATLEADAEAEASEATDEIVAKHKGGKR